MTNDTKCKWCKKTFIRMSSFLAHMCPKKRRWADKGLSHVRLGFRVYQKFYEMTTFSANIKSMEEFVYSPYYEGFIKFGRSCQINEYLNPTKYAEWLIIKSKKLDDWTKDNIYNEFLKEYVKKEPGVRALERNIIYLSKWEIETKVSWHDYFRKVSTPRALYDIKAAKISPWLLYLSESGVDLLRRLSDEQITIINPFIDTKFWMGIFSSNKEETKLVKEICCHAGI